ncbi:MAG: EAL domain-containing protein [Gammaproteobacteria bacterium]|jgi:diguanylate cyclase (GGDEF)-like protein
MNESSVPVAVLTLRPDDVEYFNKTMRDAGHAVRCKGFKELDALTAGLKQESPELIIFFADDHPTPIHEVSKLGKLHAPTARLIVISSDSDESAICEALQAGARDLVSRARKERIRIVYERELMAVRNELALRESSQLAKQYKEQLNAFISCSTDAIARVQEGIVVEVNQAWADIFTDSDVDAALGPLMDYFTAKSRDMLKGALIAVARDQWDGKPLSIEANGSDGGTIPVQVELHPSSHDGEPAAKLSIRCRPPAESEQATEAVVDSVLTTDPVTGFLHRQQFVELLSEKLQAGCSGNARALALVRPDKFSEIERSLGPIASEELLAGLAAILGDGLETCDIAGRFGGTVFALVLERSDVREVRAWGERMVAAVAEHLFDVAGRSLSLTCSIGIAEIGQGTDIAEDLIRNAGDATRHCRKNGGSQVTVKETSDESTLLKRADEIWVWQIKSALVENRFRLVHMNVSSLGGQAERIYDTVVRMVDGQGDEISANDFMATAARNRLLRPIDRWVVNATISFCKRDACDLVFVKLSNESVLDSTLPDWVAGQLAESGIRPERLCFQVSEDDASHYQKQTAALAAAFKRRGIRFAIENFGIGRHPERILQNIPTDFVKFDGSLTLRISDDNDIQERLRALIAMANQKSISTIASHVENANTMALLFQLGIGYMQGHYLHEPEVVLEEAV